MHIQAEVKQMLANYARLCRARSEALAADADLLGKVKDTQAGELLRVWDAEASRADELADAIGGHYEIRGIHGAS